MTYQAVYSLGVLSPVFSPWHAPPLNFRVPIQSGKGIVLHSIGETSCPLRTVHYVVLCKIFFLILHVFIDPQVRVKLEPDYDSNEDDNESRDSRDQVSNLMKRLLLQKIPWYLCLLDIPFLV